MNVFFWIVCPGTERFPELASVSVTNLNPFGLSLNQRVWCSFPKDLSASLPFIHSFILFCILVLKKKKKKNNYNVVRTLLEMILISKVEKKFNTFFVELITAVNCEAVWEGQLEAIITPWSPPQIKACCVLSKLSTSVCLPSVFLVDGLRDTGFRSRLWNLSGSCLLSPNSKVRAVAVMKVCGYQTSLGNGSNI